MSSILPRCIALLTYKGKVLLLSKNNKPDVLSYNPWQFIEKEKSKHFSELDTIIREILKETKIKITELIPIPKNSTSETPEYVFHAQLTDINVNTIQRDDESLLQFYSLSELQKLNLQDSTKNILSKYKSTLELLMN